MLSSVFPDIFGRGHQVITQYTDTQNEWWHKILFTVTDLCRLIHHTSVNCN